MLYRRLGNTGLNVSRICLGCMSFGTPGAALPGEPSRSEWVLNEADARPFFKRAFELGINFFDTANVYSLGGSEEVTGRALKELGRRDDYVLATKVWGTMRPGPNGSGLSRKSIFGELDASLKRLGHDYVDLYQIHRWDPHTPIEETMEALNDVVRSGKVRYLGASSMAAWQFQKAQQIAERHGWARFVSMQNHYNLVYREEEREMVPLCKDLGVGLIPWSPLARGLLARAPGAKSTLRSEKDRFGKMLYSPVADADAKVLAALDQLSQTRKLPHAQLALSWLLGKDGVTAPIIGATKLEHLETAVKALETPLSKEEAAALEQPYVPHPVAGY